MRSGIRGVLVAGGIGLAAFSAWAAQPEPPTIYVQARENLSGFNGSELTDFLARTMSRAEPTTWRFAAAPAGRVLPDRVEWSFVPGAEAAGSVRTYGFSRAMMTRLVGSSRVYTIEARLYLRGEYQALASGQFRLTDDPQNSELSAEIGAIVHNLMATPDVIDKAAQPDPAARTLHPTI